MFGMLDDSDFELYKNKLEDAANEITMITRSIPGMKIELDESIFSFIEGKEDEVAKFISQLVKEL